MPSLSSGERMDMDTDAGNDEANLEEVKCSKCGEVLGWIQTIDGVRFFTYGSGPVEAMRMVCEKCGEVFNWETNWKAYRLDVMRKSIESK